MATILITGAAGFIGSSLAQRLLEQGHVVYGVDNYSTGSRDNIAALEQHENFTFTACDINTSTFLEQCAGISITHIYHLACPTGVPNLSTLAEEMLLTCSLGVFNVATLAEKHNARVLFSSTAEVYGQPEQTPQDESYTGNVDCIGPRSAYEEGKRFSEAYLVMCVRSKGIDARIVRVFNTYGPNMSLEDKRVIPQFISSILNSEPLCVYGDGSQTRSHLYIDDLLDGFELVMHHGTAGEAYNIGSDHPITIQQLAEYMIKIGEHVAGIAYKEHFIEDHNQRCPGVEKVQALGWQQHVSISEGLQRMLAHHRIAIAPTKCHAYAGIT